MKKIYSLVLLAFLSVLGVQAQNSVTAVDQTYSQDFNTLVGTGTSNSFALANWESNRAIYIASDGQSTTGALYSFGSTSASDRALGSLNSGSTPKIYFGTSFKNNSGQELNKIAVSYKGEQWKIGNKTVGGVRVADTLYFQYSLEASGAADSTANWVTVNELSFISPVTNVSDAKVDGNAAENSKTVSGDLNVAVPAGATLVIRWSNERSTVGVAGSRDGLGIDDLTVTFGEGGEEPVDECDFDYNATPNIATFSNDLESFDLTFKPVEGATGYIAVLADLYEIQDDYLFIPEDGEVYEVGDYFDGYEVVSISNSTSLSISGLYEMSEYTIYIYPYFECDGDITYGASDEHYFITAEACEVAEYLETNFVSATIGSTSASFELMPVDGAAGYIVLLDAIGDNTEYNEYGEPAAYTEYEVGDKINESLIVHVGTSTSFTISDLNPEFYYEIYAHPYFVCDGDLLYGWYNGTEFVTTSVPTAIKNNVSKDMLIYPNPVAGNVINVRLDASAQGKANIQIHNVLGAQVYANQATLSSENRIVLPNRLPAGRYSIRIEQDGKAQVGSFIVIQ